MYKGTGRIVGTYPPSVNQVQDGLGGPTDPAARKTRPYNYLNKSDLIDLFN